MDRRGAGYTRLNRVAGEPEKTTGFFGSLEGPCYDFKVIDPNNSKWLSTWDMFVSALLLFVAILAPYETAFLEPKLDMLFSFNRFVDIVFIIDIILQFMTACPDQDRPGHQLRDPVEVAKAYLKCWFWIDIASILPIDIILVSTDAKWIPLGKAFRNLKAIRLLRLVRLLRLARVQRILERWQTAIGINYSMIALLQFSVVIAATSHWMACLWGGVALQRGGNFNWLTALRAAKGGPEEQYTSHMDVYCSSLYWAIVTLTSIGYGDITPQNRVEYILATICMSIMSGLWAYVIGAVCGIVATLQPHEVNFKQTMDDLNSMMEDCLMPSPVRERLRRYFHEARDMGRQRVERSIIDQMSPSLQGEVALCVHGRWIQSVRFLREIGTNVFIWIARCLTTMVYAPREEVYRERTLFIIRRGICARKGKVLSVGDAWGFDMLLENEHLRDTTFTRALSYLHVLMLHASDVLRMESKFPEIHSALVRERVIISIKRGIPKIAAVLNTIKQLEGATLEDIDPDKRGLLYADVFKGTFNISRLDQYLVRTPTAIRRLCDGTLETAVGLLDTLAADIAALANKVNELTLSQTELCANVSNLST